jgi:hypothetical protein
MSANDLDFAPPPRDSAAAEALSLAAAWTELDVRIILDTDDDPDAADPRSPRFVTAAGTILNRLFDAAGRQWWFVLLDAPARYPIPEGSDLTRYPADHRGRDDSGEHFWAYVVLISSAEAQSPLLIGVTDHLVDLAVVVDVSVRDDPEVDPAKVTPAIRATATIGLSEDPDQASEPPSDQYSVAAAAAGTYGVTTDPAAPVQRTTAAPVVMPRADPGRAASWLHEELQRLITVLRPLAGEIALAEIPLPQRIAPSTTPADTHPQYVITETAFAYYSQDPRRGFIWRTTTDPAELLFWCVDDVARSLAWRWAQRAPSFAAMPPAVAQRTLWAPYWQLLMTAADPQWGAATGRALREIL